MSQLAHPLRLAVLGCGAISRDVHLPLLTRRADVRVTVVADRSLEALVRARRLVPAADAVRDWQDALARQDVDAVVVALPPALHCQAAVTALSRGCHLFLEKPMVTTEDDAVELLHQAATTSLTTMVGLNYRFNPLYDAMRRHVANGGVGRVSLVRTIFTTDMRPGDMWRRTRAAGGGTLLELGSHHVDLVHWLTAATTRDVRCSVVGRDTDHECATLQLGLDKDIAAEIVVGCGLVNDDRIEVHGDRGAVAVDRYRSLAPSTRGPAVPGRAETIAAAVTSLGHLPYLWRKLRSPRNEPSHSVALDRFITAAARRMPVSPGLADGWDSLRVILAAQASADSGRVVTIDSKAWAPRRAVHA